MTGTKEGARKAQQTTKQRHGEDFFKRIGQKGGRVTGKASGFASDKVGADGLTGIERARIAGKKGGSISRRGASKKGVY